MSKGFSKKWDAQIEGLKEALRHSKPLKHNINNAINHIEQQLSKIDSHINEYTRREKEIFEKLVHAYEKHDDVRAKMFANELAEIRRQKAILMHSRLSLDNASLRLRTVFEFGNVVSVLTSAVDTIESVRTGISRITPEVGGELSQVEATLNDLMINMGQNVGATPDFDAKSEEAEKIIKEAALIAESRMKTRFPELPNNISDGGLIVKKDSNAKEQ